MNVDFFVNDMATTESRTVKHTLALHDALPILHVKAGGRGMTEQTVVVGAGPAGIRSAQTLVEHGIRPLLVDEAPKVGGQIYRQPPAELKRRSEEHTSELQSLMRTSYAVLCVNKNT